MEKKTFGAARVAANFNTKSLTGFMKEFINKKMMLSAAAAVVLVVALSGLQSCNKSEINVPPYSHSKYLSKKKLKDSECLSLLEKKMSLSVYEVKMKNNDFVNDSSLVLYNKKTNEFFIINKTEIANQVKLVRGIYSANKFIVIKVVTLVDNLDTYGNGNMIISDETNHVGFIQEFSDNKIKKSSSPSKVSKVRFKTNTIESLLGWSPCQRKRDETFSQCFTRETNEFCDDAISTIAYATNPSIPVIIAALCSCYE